MYCHKYYLGSITILSSLTNTKGVASICVRGQHELRHTKKPQKFIPTEECQTVFLLCIYFAFLSIGLYCKMN